MKRTEGGQSASSWDNINCILQHSQFLVIYMSCTYLVRRSYKITNMQLRRACT